MKHFIHLSRASEKLSSWVIARVTGCLARGANYLRLASGTPWVIGQHCPCHDIAGTGMKYITSQFREHRPILRIWGVWGVPPYGKSDSSLYIILPFNKAASDMRKAKSWNHQKKHQIAKISFITLSSSDYLSELQLFVLKERRCFANRIVKLQMEGTFALLCCGLEINCPGLHNTIYPHRKLKLLQVNAFPNGFGYFFVHVQMGNFWGGQNSCQDGFCTF